MRIELRLSSRHCFFLMMLLALCLHRLSSFVPSCDSFVVHFYARLHRPPDDVESLTLWTQDLSPRLCVCVVCVNWLCSHVMYVVTFSEIGNGIT